MNVSPEATYQKIHADFLRGDLGEALADAEHARRQFAGRNRAWDMKFRLLEAEVLTHQGNSPRVVQLLGDYRPTLFMTADSEIKRQLLLTLANSRLNQVDRSNQEIQRAQRLSIADESVLQGEVLQTEGLIAVHRDQLASASDAFERSLDFARQHGDKFLETSALLNLGTVSLRYEEYDKALARFEDASRIAVSTGARLALQLALGNAGWAYYKLGDFEKSLLNFQQAEKRAKELGSIHDQIVWATLTGLSFYRLGNPKSAESNYRRALAAAKAVNDKELIAATHTELGSLFLQRRQFNLAQQQSLDALKAAHAWGGRSAVLDALFLQGLLAARSKSGDAATHLLMQVYRDPVTMPSRREEIENAIARYYARVNNNLAAEVWFRKSVATFETRRSSLKDDEMKLPFFANADSLYKDYARFLIQSHRSRDALQLLDRGRAQTLEEGLGITSHRSQMVHQQSVDAQAVAKRLNATILFYALCPEQSYLWAINGHHTRLFLLPGRSEIDSHVRKYRLAILRSTDPLRQKNEDARYLFNTLVAPAAADLRKGARVVLISDGSLDELNFETLLAPGEAGFHYWIDDVTLVNTNSIILISIPDSQDDRDHGDGLLLIGDPVSSGSNYPRLLNAESEIRSIEKHFSPDQEVVLTRASAVPAAYTAGQPGNFSYIHFVAHGTASRLSPLDSEVILSPPSGDPPTYKLYARDIVKKRLHARLVTISTCYGSGLRAYAGEGLVGLSWAFLRAGAHNVIGALWQASDAATPKLMDRLYSEIENGDEPDSALRAAKLSLIHSESVYRKPLYWAPFQLYAGGEESK